jgi:hypothetical protein
MMKFTELELTEQRFLCCILASCAVSGYTEGIMSDKIIPKVAEQIKDYILYGDQNGEKKTA